MIVLRSDDAIHDEITHDLEWDSRIDASAMNVTVSNRTVTLTGTATSYEEKIVAQKIAHSVPGVLDVANELVVSIRGRGERSDTALAAAVRHALQWDVRVPDERITSTVSMGCVTLEGTVRSLREREDAEKAVRPLHGVRMIFNRITVEQRSVASAQIHAAIEGALARRARHEAKRIEVLVEDGVVTLTGPVESFAEKRAILGLIGHLAGVHAVRDHLMLPA